MHNLGGGGEGVAIPVDKIVEFATAVNKDPRSRLAKSVLAKMKIKDVATDQDSHVERVFKYHLKPNVLPLTNQQASGRCWIFSFTNLIKRKMINEYKLPPSFKLSQKFILMFDHVEKCNALVEVLYYVIHKKNVPIASLEMQYFRSMYSTDGGTWDFFANIVLKYGLVPYDTYPDNMQSTHTYDLNEMLIDYVSAQSQAIRNAPAREDFAKLKWDILAKCYQVLETFLGAPPQTFAWRYEDVNGKFHEHKSCTPTEFYETYVKPHVDVTKYVVLINDPRAENPYNTMYSVELLHNVLADNVADSDLMRLPTNKYFNVETSTMRKAILESIKRNTAVPFCADMNRFARHTESRLDMNVNLEDLLPIKLVYPKKFLFENLLSSPNHAMLIVGCNGQDGDWQVENSWGKVVPINDVELPEFPYLTMSDEWFENYVGEACVHISCLDRTSRQKYKSLVGDVSKYRFYPYWDAFSTIASIADESKRNRGGKKQRVRP